MARGKKAAEVVSLGLFREDPDNVSEATAEEIERLAHKLKAVPKGLEAQPIAYVTDAGDGYMVISGNKRLRCLKAAYGEDGEVPACWFVDVTSMTEEERHKFRLWANKNDGHFNIDKLLEQYGAEEVSEAGLDELIKQVTPTGGGTKGKGEEGTGDEEINAESHCNYKEQYGVIVMCKDEKDQADIYNRLHDMGYDCKVVAT